ncbi:MAG TPA: aspartate kinase [Wenzhouxiangella sp.]|nr:aspartate kinase [Wenzhouxiangella sp.]
MDIIVQKYGGSSLAQDEQLQAVAERVSRCKEAGKGVVVVVSARGKTTSQLLARAGKLNSNPEHRELDMLLAAGEQASASMLSLALHDLGHEAVSLTGLQAGVKTCDSHMNACIRTVDPERMLEMLAEGKIVVGAGFQGESPCGDITTLGRGGSDTTAVALAAAVGAGRCEIYSDVDGVYTADPRKVPEATRLDTISLAEMKTLAHHGAGVLNERAIDYAIEHGVTIVCRQAHGDGGRTIVRAEPELKHARIVGIASHDELLQVEFDETANHAKLADRLDDLDIFVPELAAGRSGRYLISIGQLADDQGLANSIREEFDQGIAVSGPIASVSAVGYKAGSRARVEELARKKLEAEGIAVHEVMRFEHAVTCLIDCNAVERAMQLFHECFDINCSGSGSDIEVDNVAA